jgi:hypothetical protein
MSYKDRYGSTVINNEKIDNLQINWDYDDDAEDIKQRFPVLLYTPWMEDTKNHFHISLNKEQAKVMKEWLEEYLKEQEEVK